MVVVTEGQEMTDVLWFVSCVSLYFPCIYIYIYLYTHKYIYIYIIIIVLLLFKLQYIIISYYSPRVG